MLRRYQNKYSKFKKEFWDLPLLSFRWPQKCIQNSVTDLRLSVFAEIVNSWKPLTISAKGSILDIWQDSEYTTGPRNSTNHPVKKQTVRQLKSGLKISQFVEGLRPTPHFKNTSPPFWVIPPFLKISTPLPLPHFQDKIFRTPNLKFYS